MAGASETLHEAREGLGAASGAAVPPVCGKD